MVPTACHRPLGRRMPAGGKQRSASSPSCDSWLGTQGETGVLKSLSASEVDMEELGWCDGCSMFLEVPRCRTCRWGGLAQRGWLLCTLLTPWSSPRWVQTAWNPRSQALHSATCLGKQRFPLQLCNIINNDNDIRVDWCPIKLGMCRDKT